MEPTFPLVVADVDALRRLLMYAGESETRHGEHETTADMLDVVAQWQRDDLAARYPLPHRAYVKRTPLPAHQMDATYGWPEGTTATIRALPMTDDELVEDAP